MTTMWWFRATANARPENDGVENDGQTTKELQGLENAGLENDGQTFSNSVLYMNYELCDMNTHMPNNIFKSFL